MAPLIEAIKGELIEEEIARALGKVYDEQSIEPLIQAFEERVITLQKCVIRALMSIILEKGISDVTPHFQDVFVENRRIRRIADEILSKMEIANERD